MLSLLLASCGLSRQLVSADRLDDVGGGSGHHGIVGGFGSASSSDRAPGGSSVAVWSASASMEGSAWIGSLT